MIRRRSATVRVGQRVQLVRHDVLTLPTEQVRAVLEYRSFVEVCHAPASLRNYRASASANRQCSYDEHTDHRGLGNGCTRTGACAVARNLAEMRAPGCVIGLRVASAEA